ncbi:sirohydrochlorin cobaltochelatase [Spirochaetia bacterium]|nr:sirohydrochlorin cobaltochelatase [Spirochaetia bacterium]
MKTLYKSMTVIFLSIVSAGLVLSCASSQPQGTKKPVLLVVSFGTSFAESRAATIGGIENAITKAYPDYEVRRAFTSQIIIDHIKRDGGEKIDNVSEAIKRLRKDGVKEVVVQPTHIMSGIEYNELVDTFKAQEKYFTSVKFGKPLLSSDADYNRLVTVLTDVTKEYSDGNTAIVFMGHGTEHSANETYTRLANLIKQKGITNYYIGTVEAAPSLDDVINDISKTKVKKVLLQPLMIVAGDHANNDMAGDEDDSWKTIITGKGYSVSAVLKGLGQFPEVQAMFVEHAGAVIR